MHEPDQVIDEYTLAAFIAGTLTKRRRQEVIEYLAGNADAREVLHMAYMALGAAQSGDHDYEPSSLLRPRRKADRPATGLMRLREAGRYVAATAFVFAVGIVLRLAFGPPTDALRSPLPRDAQGIEVTVTTPGPEFAWLSVANAYQYRIVVWDPQEARVVGQYESSDSRVESDDPIILDLKPKLRRGSPYTIRVDAIDAQNRLIRSSETVEFTAR